MIIGLLLLFSFTNVSGKYLGCGTLKEYSCAENSEVYFVGCAETDSFETHLLKGSTLPRSMGVNSRYLPLPWATKRAICSDACVKKQYEYFSIHKTRPDTDSTPPACFCIKTKPAVNTYSATVRESECTQTDVLYAATILKRVDTSGWCIKGQKQTGECKCGTQQCQNDDVCNFYKTGSPPFEFMNKECHTECLHFKCPAGKFSKRGVSQLKCNGRERGSIYVGKCADICCTSNRYEKKGNNACKGEKFGQMDGVNEEQCEQDATRFSKSFYSWSKGGGNVNGRCMLFNSLMKPFQVQNWSWDWGCYVKVAGPVSCGGHQAPNCAKCPYSVGGPFTAKTFKGAAWCNGECSFNNEKNLCELKEEVQVGGLDCYMCPSKQALAQGQVWEPRCSYEQCSNLCWNQDYGSDGFFEMNAFSICLKQRCHCMKASLNCVHRCKYGQTLETHGLNENHGDVCRPRHGIVWKCPVGCVETRSRSAPYCIIQGTNTECHKSTSICKRKVGTEIQQEDAVSGPLYVADDTMVGKIGSNALLDTGSKVAMSNFSEMPTWAYGTIYALIGLNLIVVLSVMCGINKNGKEGSEALLDEY